MPFINKYKQGMIYLPHILWSDMNAAARPIRKQQAVSA